MKLTNEIWKEFGFTKNSSLGGECRWYYNRVNFRGGMSGTQYGNNISLGGIFSFPCNDPKTPQTLKELTNYMQDLHINYGKCLGEANLQGQFKTLLGIDDEN